ncbi:Rne/Rng family ribonuclease [Myxococcota bacterium]|nr:Rne/Rng family ribonuclease [Myxococcota bacterium]
MSKKMLFNVNEPEEVRAAIIENGKLVEFDVENRLREKNRNNIYRGYVVRVEPSIQAVFVEYGAGRHGFLPFHEIHPDFWSSHSPKDKDRPRVDEVLQKGQPVLVQVVREELENKGAALTTYCTIPGRYVVLMPRSGGGGVSRKIDDAEQRKALRDFMRDLKLPDGFGIIVRTAGMGRPIEDIQRELDYLLRLWRTIQQQSKRGPRAGCVFQDSDIIQRMIRDYYDSSIDEILVDEEEAFERARDYYAALISSQQNIVRFYDEDRPLFTHYNIEPQISEVFERKISLASGGSIVIDQAEALVAIDVNSGRAQSENNTEDTALRTNIEACYEISRQLRLRDLGGLIVIDFISMRILRNTREVERHFRLAIQHDKARIRIGKISASFGLLSLSRQRIRDSKALGHFIPCPHCNGHGQLPNPEASALMVLRRLQELALQKRFERVEARLPHDVAIYMLNHKREELHYLFQEYSLLAEILPREGGCIDLENDLQGFLATHPLVRKKREREPLQVDLSKLPEDRRLEDKRPEETRTDNKRLEDKRLEDKRPDDAADNKRLEDKRLEDKRPDDAADNKRLEDKRLEDKRLEDRRPDDAADNKIPLQKHREQGPLRSNERPSFSARSESPRSPVPTVPSEPLSQPPLVGDAPSSPSSRSYVSPLAPRPPKEIPLVQPAAREKVPLFEPRRNPLESIQLATSAPFSKSAVAKPAPNVPLTEPVGLERERFSLDPSHRPVTLRSPLDHFDLASSLASAPVGLPWFMRFLPVEQQLHTQRLQTWASLQQEALASGTIASIEQPRAEPEDPLSLPQSHVDRPSSINVPPAPEQSPHEEVDVDDLPPTHLAPESASELRHLRRGGRRPRYRGRDRDRRPHVGS